jgi:hypothetical protein
MIKEGFELWNSKLSHSSRNVAAYRHLRAILRGL